QQRARHHAGKPGRDPVEHAAARLRRDGDDADRRVAHVDRADQGRRRAIRIDRVEVARDECAARRRLRAQAGCVKRLLRGGARRAKDRGGGDQRGTHTYHAAMARQCGFTLIEMLTVMAVLGVLALMAVPSMRDGVLRKQVSEGLVLADVARVGVQTAWALNGAMPADNKAAGVPDSRKIVGNVVQEVSVEQGAITVTFGNNASKAIEGKRVTLRPA